MTLLQVFREDTLSLCPLRYSRPWHIPQPGPCLTFHHQHLTRWEKASSLLRGKLHWVRPLAQRAPGSVERAWALAVKDLSSRPDAALTGRATLAKRLNLSELQLLHLQNGDNKAVIYFISLLWGCGAWGLREGGARGNRQAGSEPSLRSPHESVCLHWGRGSWGLGSPRGCVAWGLEVTFQLHHPLGTGAFSVSDTLHLSVPT